MGTSEHLALAFATSKSSRLAGHSATCRGSMHVSGHSLTFGSPLIFSMQWSDKRISTLKNCQQIRCLFRSWNTDQRSQLPNLIKTVMLKSFMLLVLDSIVIYTTVLI